MSPKLAPFRLLMPPMDRIFREDSENQVPGAQFRPKWSILERNRAGMRIVSRGPTLVVFFLTSYPTPAGLR